MISKKKGAGRIGLLLQQAVEEEITTAIESLERLKPESLPDGAEKARRNFARLHALLQLVRKEIGKSAYSENKACFQAAGDALLATRQPAALLKTLEALRKRFFHARQPTLVVEARQMLLLAGSGSPDLLDRRTNKAFLQTLRVARHRCSQWKLQEFGWKEARRALRRSYQRARQSWQKAAASQRSRDLEGWRQRTDDFYESAVLLRREAPLFLEEAAHSLQALSEFLRDDCDLANLERELEERRSELPAAAHQMDAFLKMLALRRRELTDAAFDLGQYFFERPAASWARLLTEKRAVRRKLKRKARKLRSEME